MLPRGSIGMRDVRRGSEDAAEEGRDRYYGVHHRYRLRKLCGPHYEQRAGNRQGDQGYSGRCSFERGDRDL